MKTKKEFFLRVKIGPRCWVWKGAKTPYGYGSLKWKGKGASAHRVAYELTGKKIPAGLQIDHLCRNRLCVNPSHMEAVTQRENMMRGNGFSAKNARKKICVNGHKLEGNFYLINGARHCKTCVKNRKEKNGKCYKCQLKERKGEVGPNKKAYNLEMRGNTMVLAECDSCGKKTGILPVSDMNRAIKASNNKFIHPHEWD